MSSYRSLIFLAFYFAGYMACGVSGLGTFGKVMAFVIGFAAGWCSDDAVRWVARGAE